MAWFIRGSLNFVVGVLAQVMLSVLDVQKRWLLKKWWIESTTSYSTIVDWKCVRLVMRKLSARWLPHLLTADHKRARMIASEQCLGMFQRNSKEFLRRYVTVDETRIHYYTTETKSRSKMCTGSDEFAPKKRRWGSINRQGHGHNFLGLTWYNINWLSTEWKSYYRRALCLIIRSIWCHTEGKAASSGEKKCFSTTTMHQLTRVLLQRTNYLICATKYFLIHLITQIWLLPINFCFLTCKNLAWT